MKKLLFVALLLVLGLMTVNSAKAAEPVCEAGTHLESNVVEKTVCERVCTKKVWGICVSYKNVCSQVSETVYSCVADPIIEDPEEPIEEPVIPAPSIISGSGTPLYLILKNYCLDNQVEYTNWSTCDTRFGKNGLQYRDLLKTKNGCNPTSVQQINRIRECVN
jgi:hypothetical protein